MAGGKVCHRQPHIITRQPSVDVNSHRLNRCPLPVRPSVLGSNHPLAGGVPIKLWCPLFNCEQLRMLGVWARAGDHLKGARQCGTNRAWD